MPGNGGFCPLVFLSAMTRKLPTLCECRDDGPLATRGRTRPRGLHLTPVGAHRGRSPVQVERRQRGKDAAVDVLAGRAAAGRRHPRDPASPVRWLRKSAERTQLGPKVDSTTSSRPSRRNAVWRRFAAVAVARIEHAAHHLVVDAESPGEREPRQAAVPERQHQRRLGGHRRRHRDPMLAGAPRAGPGNRLSVPAAAMIPRAAESRTILVGSVIWAHTRFSCLSGVPSWSEMRDRESPRSSVVLEGAVAASLNRRRQGGEFDGGIEFEEGLAHALVVFRHDDPTHLHGSHALPRLVDGYPSLPGSFAGLPLDCRGQMARFTVSPFVLLDSPSQVAGPANVTRMVLDEECVDARLSWRFSVTNRDRGAADQFAVVALNVAQSRTDVVAFELSHNRRIMEHLGCCSASERNATRESLGWPALSPGARADARGRPSSEITVPRHRVRRSLRRSSAPHSGSSSGSGPA